MMEKADPKPQEPQVPTTDLAAIAQMAAGLAHEIRNPLAGIQGVIEVLRDQSSDETQHQVLCEVLNEVGRIDQLVRELICFAKPQYQQVRPLRLDILVNDVARRLAREWGSSMTIEVSGDPHCLGLRVMADEDCLSKVLENVICNAIEAVKGQGTLRLAFSCDGERLTLRLQDDGPGVPPEIQDKIFDPFYTTKPSGTGLGLSLCQRLIQQQEGTLALDRECSQGAAFVLTLPLCNNEANRSGGGGGFQENSVDE